MSDKPVTHPWWSRRDFLKTSAAAAAAYGMPWGPASAAELPAEDVKATFDRISKPPQGISIPRSVLFKAVSEIAAPDKYTVQFKLSEPRPPSFIMSAIASGWNVVLRKKTLEDNGYNLRKVEFYPGTGPFKSVKRAVNETWVLEENPNCWTMGLPYVVG